ncbi:MAG: hypothetical protein ACTSR0_00605 [Candidatus Asgardarchaeia archaeon]
METALKDEQFIKGKQTHLVKFSTLSMDSAVHSGNFSLLDAETQHAVCEMYIFFKNSEMWANKILSMIGSVDMAISAAKEYLQEFNSKLIKTLQRSKDKLPKLIKLLEKKITELQEL